MGAQCQTLHSLLDARQPAMGGRRPKLLPGNRMDQAVGRDGCLALWSEYRPGVEVGQASPPIWRLSHPLSCVWEELQLAVTEWVLPCTECRFTLCSGRPLSVTPPGCEWAPTQAMPPRSPRCRVGSPILSEAWQFLGCRADTPPCSLASLMPLNQCTL